MDSDVRRLGDTIADLQRRLAALETAPRSNFTTVRGGQTVWRSGETGGAYVAISGDMEGDDTGLYLVDSTDETRGYIGTLASGAVLGLYLDNPDKSHRAFTWLSDRGLIGPYGTGPWTKNPSQTIDALGNTTTTSGTFEVGWRTLLYVTSTTFEIEYFVDLGAATAAEVTLVADVYVDDRSAAVPAAAQTILTRTISSTNPYSDAGTLPDTLWTPNGSPVGSLLRLEFKARVSGGAGTVSWAPIVPMSLR